MNFLFVYCLKPYKKDYQPPEAPPPPKLPPPPEKLSLSSEENPPKILPPKPPPDAELKGDQLLFFLLPLYFLSYPKKLEKKNLDIIVANNASTMGTDSNTIEIIKKDKSSIEIKQKSKIELAYDILLEVISVLKKGKNE